MSSKSSPDRMIHIRIPEDLHRRMRIHVAELDTTIQHWVASVIEKELEKGQPPALEGQHD